MSRPWRIHELTPARADHRLRPVARLLGGGSRGGGRRSATGCRPTSYMLAIAPFRHLIVYPTMLREFNAAWLSAPS
jgi:hypothetical protein